MKKPTDADAMKYTIVVSAAALMCLTPYSGCSIAEFRDNAKHSLMIMIDYQKRLWLIVRCLCCFQDPSAANEVYPGDVLYLHSYLLEKEAK